MLTKPQLRHVRRVGQLELLHLLGDRPEIAALTGEVKPQDGQGDAEMLTPLRGHRRFPGRGDGEIPRALLQRAAHQLGGGRYRGELRIAGDGIGGERGDELVHGGGLPGQGDVEPVIGQQAAGPLPVPRRLSVADRLHAEPMLGEPAGRRTVQGGEFGRLGIPQLRLEQISEQPVVAKPGSPCVQRDHERPGLL